MPNINEVFEAARKGRKVHHRNFGECSVPAIGVLCRKTGDGHWTPMAMGAIELDPDAWTIEPELLPFKVGDRIRVVNGQVSSNNIHNGDIAEVIATTNEGPQPYLCRNDKWEGHKGQSVTLASGKLSRDNHAWFFEASEIELAPPKPKPERFESGQKFALGSGRATVISAWQGLVTAFGCIDYGKGDLHWVRLDRFLEEGWELI